MVSLLGIRQLAVVVNKMDLVGWDRAVFDRIVRGVRRLPRTGRHPAQCFIPASGRGGDNIADPLRLICPGTRGRRSSRRSTGSAPSPHRSSSPFRMPVQGVYKFTKQGDDRRIVAGTIDSGAVSVGDEVIFYPSGKKSRVKSIEGFNRRSGRGRRPARPRASRCRSRSTSRAARWPRSKGSPVRRSRPGSASASSGSARNRWSVDKEYLLKLGHGPGYRTIGGDSAGDGRLHAGGGRTADGGPATRRGRVRAQAGPGDRLRSGRVGGRNQSLRAGRGFRDSGRRNRARGARPTGRLRRATGSCCATTSGSPASSRRSGVRRSTTRRPR